MMSTEAVFTPDDIVRLLQPVLRRGYVAEPYDDWPGAHPAHVSVVAPGNDGAGYVVATVYMDGVVVGRGCERDELVDDHKKETAP